MSSSDHRPQTLEVEDAEQRQKRLRMCSVFPPFFSRPTQCGFFLVWSTEAILERLNGEGSSTGESPNLSFDFGDRRTFAMEPPTERACHPPPSTTLAVALHITEKQCSRESNNSYLRSSGPTWNYHRWILGALISSTSRRRTSASSKWQVARKKKLL